MTKNQAGFLSVPLILWTSAP